MIITLFFFLQEIYGNIHEMITRTSDSIKKHFVAFAFSPLIKLVEAVFDLLIPLFMKAVIDLNQYASIEDIPSPITRALAEFIRVFPSINDNQAISDALIGGIIILIMGIVGFSLTMWAQYIAATTSVKVGSEIRNALFAKVMKMSKKEVDEIGISKIITVINSDTYQLQHGALLYIRLIARAPFILLGSLVFSYILNWKIGIAFTVIIPLIIFVVFFVLSKASKSYVGIQQQLDTITEKTEDSIEGNRIIRALNK